MHPSRYNVFFKSEDGRFLLFNTLSRSKVFVDDELKTIIEKGVYTEVDPGIISQLQRCGVIVEGDELKTVLDLYHRRVQTPFEYEVTVLPTYECNLTCYYCTRSKETFSSSLVQELIAFFSRELETTECENVAVRIGGGEPLLYPDLLSSVVEGLSHVTQEHGRKFFSGLATNGTLPIENVLGRLSFNAVQITFEGCRTYHDSVRHDSGGTFDRVVESAGMVRDAGIPLNVRVHVSPESVGGMGQLFDELRSAGILGQKTFITAAPVIPTRICPFYPAWCTESEEALHVLPMAWEAAQRCQIPLPQIPSPVYEVLPCQYTTSTSIVVNPTGSLYTCLRAAAERRDQVGSVGEGRSRLNPLEMPASWWQGTDCETCPLLVLCGGGCAWRKVNTRERCGVTRELLMDRIRMSLRREHKIV